MPYLRACSSVVGYSTDKGTIPVCGEQVAYDRCDPARREPDRAVARHASAISAWNGECKLPTIPYHEMQHASRRHSPIVFRLRLSWRDLVVVARMTDVD